MLGVGSPLPPWTSDARVSTGQSVSPNSVYELLLSLRKRGIEVRADGERLRLTGRAGCIDDDSRETVRRHKQELLAFLRPSARDVASSAPRQRVKRSKSLPLAPAQRRLWLLEKVSPQRTAYSLPYAFHIAGEVDVPALRRALTTLYERHAALRMIFAEAAGEVVQRESGASLPFEVVTWAQDEQALADELAREAARPFDLQRGPLLAARLYRCSDASVFFLNVHHIVCDGWSMEVLLEELLASYGAYHEGREPALPPLPESYAELVDNELARCEGERASSELAQAVTRLAELEPLELPTDSPRPARFDLAGETLHFALDAELSRAVETLARRSGVTPYIVLLAAYELVLARYSGQLDLAVGTPVSGRERSESEHAVGFFARTVVVRARIDPALPFSSALVRVKRACLAAFEDQYVPFERLVEALNPPRDAGHTPLFQALFSLQQTTSRVDPVTGQPWKQLAVHSPGAKTDLTLLFEFDGARFTGKLEYARSLFERATVERLLQNYETLLRAAVRHPEHPCGRLPLLSPGELTLLDAYNETAAPLPSVGGFYELIRAQAQRTPERIAVVDRDGPMSYRELDQRSDAWAARLARRGVRRGSRVGVAMTRTRRVLEVMLGAMKAGAAYVPLDPSFPRERLTYMADDAGLSCIVAEAETRANLPRSLDIVLADEELDLTVESPRVSNGAEDVAYMIYTSGSTGEPKGVEVQHGGVVNLLLSMAKVPGVSADDRVLAVSTFNFDMCIAELYLPLVVGARTILAPKTCAADGAMLARFIDEYGATLVQATPTTFKLLVDAGLPRQRFRAIGGGEAFPSSLARALEPSCDEVWNGYGPTETTVYATFYRIDDASAPVLIGMPIANTRLYVLDAQGERVPLGAPGELYIGGSGVSAGYRGKPELTSARYLSDPFADHSARMYRTGDIVRLRRGGVQYLGRVDHQVKLRGYRIELGEIESVLSKHSQVEQCCVVVRELGDDDKRLVAYVASSEDPSRLRASLRQHLERELPRYMVPRLIAVLPALPLTASGKIDRKRLPEPRDVVLANEAARTPEWDATERALYDVWRGVLGTGDIGPDDDFFALGGHSLLAARLIDAINTALHTSLSLGVVFESPTIRAQAERINLGEHSGGMSVVPLRRDGEREPLFCICGINLYQPLADRLNVDRPVYGLFLPSEGALLRGESITLDVREMAREYVRAIRAVQPSGPYYLAGLSFGGVLAFEIAQSLRATGEDVARLVLLDTILPSARPIATVHERLSSQLRALVGRARLRRLRSALARLPLPFARSRIDGGPADVDASERMDHRTERYHRALDAYVPTMARYEGAAVLVRGLDQVRAMPGCAEDYGWTGYVAGLTRFDVPGDHLGILAEPHVEHLAACLTRLLG